ncbi:MAG: peptidylprolyl isomerase [Pseudomonadota bacterium]|nr:peptidylprolyl isomerase [Pseudomonadota bacterium]
MVMMETTEGNIKIELFDESAPDTVSNFKSYVESNFFNETIFHRVINGFMIQGGGLNADMSEKESMQAIKNEATNGKSNKRGTIAMARTSDPHSATSQFFINLKDNEFLDFTEESPQGWGYCVFGEVIEGMEVVDKIAEVKTGNSGYHENVPLSPIKIISVKIL